MQVKFSVPDWVSITEDAFDGAEVEVTYDSNFGGDVTLEGTAEIDPGRWPSDWTHLVVDGRKIRSNGHVFSVKSDRHLGTVEDFEAVIDHDEAVDLVADSSDHDVDVGSDETIIQGWDHGVIEERGWMEGTFSVRLKHVGDENEPARVR